MFFQFDIEDFEKYIENSSKNPPSITKQKSVKHLVTTSPPKKSCYIDYKDGQTIKYKASIENQLEKRIEKEKFFKCSKCSDTFHTGEEWQTHYSREHPPEKQAQRKHEIRKNHRGHCCKECGKRFVTEDSLQKHQNAVHDGKHCGKCQYKTSSHSLFRDHQLNEHGINDYRSVPKDGLADMTQLSRVKSKYMCQMCNFSSTTKSAVTAHVETWHEIDEVRHVKIETHNTETLPLQKVTRTAADLSESVNLISYLCVQCRSKFNSIQNLGDHVWTEHKKHLCGECLFIGASRSELKKHNNVFHPCTTKKSDEDAEEKKSDNQDGEVTKDHEDLSQLTHLDNVMEEELDGCTIQSKQVADIEEAAEKTRVVDMTNSFGDVFFNGGGEPFLDKQPIDAAAEEGRVMGIPGTLDSSPNRLAYAKEHTISVTNNLENKPENEQIADHDQPPSILLGYAMDKELDRRPIQSRYVVDIDDFAEGGRIVDLSRLSETPQKTSGCRDKLITSVENEAEKHNESPATFKNSGKEGFRNSDSPLRTVPVEQTHPINKENVCNMCDKGFNTGHLLKKHQIAVHDEKHCEKCGYKTSSNRLLREHELSRHSAPNNHDPERFRFVEKTGQGARDDADGEEEDDDEEEEEEEDDDDDKLTNFHCIQCPLKYNTIRHLREHISIEHKKQSRVTDSPPKKQTQTTEQNISVADKIEQQLEEEHKKFFMCNRCSAKFHKGEELRKHYATKHPSPPKEYDVNPRPLSREAETRGRELDKTVLGNNVTDDPILEKIPKKVEYGKVSDDEEVKHDHSQHAELDDVMNEVLDGCTIQSQHVVDIDKAAEKSRVVDMSNSFGDDSPVFFSGDGEPFLDEQPMDIARKVMLLMPFNTEKNKDPKAKVNSTI